MYATIILDIIILGIGLAAGLWLHATLTRHRNFSGTPDVRLAHLEEELRLAREESKLMTTIARHASDGLLIQDIEGRIQWSNPAYSRLTGYSAEELRGRKPQELLLPAEERLDPQDVETFRYDVQSGILDEFEIVRNVRKNGENFWNQLGFAVVHGEHGKDPRIIVMARDVTEQIEREAALKRAKEALQLRAETDVLTSLPNRMRLNSFLQRALETAETSDNEVGLVHVDLDRFKEVNDTLGHAAGDAVLVHAATVMTARMRREDLVCRFGGDEFIIVCPGIKSFDDLTGIIDRVLDDFREPIDWGGHKIQVGASIGVAISGRGNRRREELMRQADLALYEVKNNGRNGIRLFTPELGAVISERNALSAALSRAIPSKQLDIALQPQFDLQTARVKAFEILIRWAHPKRGTLLPEDFLEVAKSSGLLADIDMIAVRRGLSALSQLHKAGHTEIGISLNVSAQSLWTKTFVDNLKWEVERNGLMPTDVSLEIAESFFFDEPEELSGNVISELGNAGFRIVLDNFGIGHSGLGNLARLDIDGVKIDRSLLRGIPDDKTSLTVVKSIYSLCGELGLFVIAEGVEKYDQAEKLSLMGGGLLQGNGISIPMQLEQALNWLDADANQTLPIFRHALPLRFG